MLKRLAACTAALALPLSLAACGGDDDGGGGNLQDQVTAMLLADLQEEEGFSVDEGCVRSAVGKISDADARLILDAGPDGDPDLSWDEATENAFFEELFSCFEFDFEFDD